MIQNFWYGIVKFLQKLFTAPEHTTLEQQLAREVDYLKTELFNERQYSKQLFEKLLFPAINRPEPVQEGPSTVAQPLFNAAARTRELERLSRERMLQAQIEQAERKAKEDEEALKAQDEQLRKSLSATG